MKTVLVAAFVLVVSAAGADELTIDLPGAASAERSTVSYSCGGERKVTAQYINTDANSLAILDLGDTTLLMANVISASGARYAARQYIWWTKGNTADLYDLTKGEDAAPEFSCEAEAG